MPRHCMCPLRDGVQDCKNVCARRARLRITTSLQQRGGDITTSKSGRARGPTPPPWGPHTPPTRLGSQHPGSKHAVLGAFCIGGFHAGLGTRDFLGILRNSLQGLAGTPETLQGLGVGHSRDRLGRVWGYLGFGHCRDSLGILWGGIRKVEQLTPRVGKRILLAPKPWFLSVRGSPGCVHRVAARRGTVTMSGPRSSEGIEPQCKICSCWSASEMTQSEPGIQTSPSSYYHCYYH